MDIATVLGIVLSFAGFLGGFVMEGGHLTSLIQVSAMLIVFGGTFGATMASFPLDKSISLPQLIIRSIIHPKEDAKEIIRQFVAFADKARREGLLVLEEDIQNVRDEFLRRGIQLVIDGTDAELVKEVLKAEVEYMRHRHEVGIQYLEGLGAYAPTFGIIGTVMGLVHVLSNLSDPSSLGPAIAAAFLATLYGVVSANAVFLPIGSKLKIVSAHEAHIREMIIEGVLSIQAGDNPRIVKEKLNAFLPPKQRLGEEE